MIDKAFIEVDISDELSYRTGLWCVQQLVVALGYQQGKRTGNLVPKFSVLQKQDEFLEFFFGNRNAKDDDRLREVYCDESYCHHHYNRNNESVWDPGDKEDIIFEKQPNKGCRYCFASAIQGPDPRVENLSFLINRQGLYQV